MFSNIQPVHRWLRKVCAGAALFVIGCSSGVVVNEGAKEEQNLRLIGRAYIDATRALGQPPKDVEEFKPFLQELGNPDTILTSPVDGQRYVILWGTPIARAARGQAEAILAHEQTGARGIRLTLSAGLLVKPMNAEEFRKAAKGP